MREIIATYLLDQKKSKKVQKQVVCTKESAKVKERKKLLSPLLQMVRILRKIPLILMGK